MRIGLGGRQLLAVDATVMPGDVLTVMGPSGSGKSTLLGFIGGFLDPAFEAQGRVFSGRTELTALPPELRRRFKYGTWFFDLPTLEERTAIWSLYCDRYGHEDPTPELLAQQWTGAEIESCCEIAWRTDSTLDDAAQYIVPVSRAAAAQIEALRAGADGKFLSASTPGVYTRAAHEQEPATMRDFD